MLKTIAKFVLLARATISNTCRKHHATTFIFSQKDVQRRSKSLIQGGCMMLNLFNKSQQESIGLNPFDRGLSDSNLT